MADALAHRGDEGRDKLRKVTCRSKYPLKRQSPNGTTHRLEGTVLQEKLEGKRRELKHLSTCRKRK